MNIDEITSSIKNKLGDENSGKIADDLANLLIYDKNLNDDIKKKDEEITRIKADKDLLVQANANLLGKIPMGKDDEEEFETSKKETNPEYFDYRTIFEKGRFKR